MQNGSHDYNAKIEQQLTADIVSNIIYDSKSDIDDWVLLKYDDLVFIGIIKDLSENEYKVKCMHEFGQNQFTIVSFVF